MPSTPIYGFRYLALSDAPDIPLSGQHLAEDVEAELARIEAAPTASAFGRTITAGTTAATSYTGSLTTSGTCGTAFIAPLSGKVTVLYACTGFNSTNGGKNYVAVRVGTGATVNAGSSFYAATDDDLFGVTLPTGADFGLGSFTEVPGLTPGSTYNVALAYRVSAGTGTFARSRVKIIPDVA